MDTNIVDKLSILPAELTVDGQTGRLQITKFKDEPDFINYWSVAYNGKNNFPIRTSDGSCLMYLVSCTEGFENAVDDIIERLKECKLI